MTKIRKEIIMPPPPAPMGVELKIVLERPPILNAQGIAQATPAQFTFSPTIDLSQAIEILSDVLNGALKTFNIQLRQQLGNRQIMNTPGNLQELKKP